MFNYLLRRSLIGLITLVLITFVIFGLIRNMPGTPLTLALAEVDPSRQISEEDMKRMEKVYGLDKPIPEAYMQWLGNLARLDLGRSISRKQPVTRLIGERIGPTMLLSVTSLGLAYLLSVPLGLYSTARSGRLDERATSTFLYMLYALPSFVAALFLLVLFAVKLNNTAFELPLFGMVSDNYNSLSTWGKMCDVGSAHDIARVLLHLRQPGLFQPLREVQHAGSHPPGLHAHGQGKRRRLLAGLGASRVP